MTQELSIKAQEKANQIAETLANGAEFMPGQDIQLTLPELKHVYSGLVRQLSNRNPIAALIYFDEEIFVSFPQHSTQRFLLPRKQHDYLMPRDFEFILLRKEYGTLARLDSFGRFLALELRRYWRWLCLIFVVVSLGLHFTGTDISYTTLSGVLIQSATVFVSVFLIFTVTQNTLMQNDLSLFKRGILHRYRRTDRNVAILGVSVIGAVILNSMFVLLPDAYAKLFNFSVYGYQFTLQNFWGAISTGIVVTMLFDAFISVVGYYLDRSQDVADRDFIQKVFADEEEQYQKISTRSSSNKA
jgi:hypothetical protein